MEERAALAALESAPRPHRDLIMRRSIFLSGLEQAAQLVLDADDLGALLDNLRTGRIPA
jgi:hypothetical protein